MKKSPDAEMPDRSLSNALLFRVFQTTNLMHKAGNNWVSGMEITTQQWAVLGALSQVRARDGMSVGELCTFLLQTRQNLTGILSRLEAQGLTSRVVDEADGRVKKVALTSKGKSVWTRLDKEIKLFCDAALVNFSEREKLVFLNCVNKLKQSLVEIDRTQGVQRGVKKGAGNGRNGVV